MLNKLHISGYRSFKDLSVEGLGRVNLITGRNNVGKSTLLEAIRLWATDGSFVTFQDILNYREEDESRVLETKYPFAAKADEFAAFHHLLHGFPILTKNGIGFSIEVKNGDQSEVLTTQYFTKAPSLDDTQTQNAFPFSLYTAGDRFRPVVTVQTPRCFRALWLNASSGNPREIVDSKGEGSPPCLFVDPFSSRSTNQTALLWDSIALTKGADAVVEALRIISRDIRAVTMVGNPTRHTRTAIAKSDAYEQPIPLKSFGDGVNRVFGLVVSLACAKGGYLLIDEIENGLHHSIQADAFRAIFKLARELDVQVFATTHSRDCIEAFQEAAAESPEDGVLVRLTRKDDKMYTTVFPEKELQIVVDNQIEVR